MVYVFANLDHSHMVTYPVPYVKQGGWRDNGTAGLPMCAPAANVWQSVYKPATHFQCCCGGSPPMRRHIRGTGPLGNQRGQNGHPLARPGCGIGCGRAAGRQFPLPRLPRRVRPCRRSESHRPEHACGFGTAGRMFRSAGFSAWPTDHPPGGTDGEEPGDSMIGWADLDDYLTVAGTARLVRQPVRADTVCAVFECGWRIALLC